jgi:phage tail-like protein
VDEPATTVLTVAQIAAAAPGPPPEPELRQSPPTASVRGYLRSGLPAMYTDPDRIRPARGRGPAFGLEFVSALEEVLDPVVAVLDCLPHHLVPEMAPLRMVDLMGCWLGIEMDERWPLHQRRMILRQAPELARWSGTRRGLEMALGLIFPDLPFRVVDRGGVVWADESDAAEPRPEFVVYCDTPLPEGAQAEVARVVDGLKPVGVRYKLRVKQRAASTAEEDPS